MVAVDTLLNSISLLTLPPFCFQTCFDCQLKDTIFDFIVVGGGSAGSVVASRLSENPKVNVLLLEAGGCPPNISAIPATFYHMMGTDVDWNFQTTKQEHAFFSNPNHQATYHSGKMLGGGSSINAMIYIRGNQYNYDSWQKLGNPGWAFKDVLPFFLKSEGNTIPSQANDIIFHNTKGPLKISEYKFKNKITQVLLDAGQQRGYPIRDPNGPNQTSVSSIPSTIDNGARSSTYSAYLLPAKDRPNLVVATNALVTKVLFNTAGNLRAIGVQYTYNNKKYTTYATKEIILSAGAFNSPKILLLSGIGPKQQLQALKIPLVLNLPGVGENLHDHVICPILQWTLNCTECGFYQYDPVSSSNIGKWITNREGPATSTDMVGVAFFPTKFANKKTNAPDIQLVFNNGQSKIMAAVLHLIAPKSRGSVTLQSADPNQPPIINPNYLSHADDWKVLVEGVKATIELGNSPAFKAKGIELYPSNFPGCKSYKQFSDKYWECAGRYTTYPGLHAAGTCKMGPSKDLLAVVNAKLQVHKIEGLRVIDNSIMPSITGGNTNAPAIMIGEKGADMIKKAHRI